MEEGGGSDRRRLSLLEQMSAFESSRDLTGLTLEAVIGNQKQPTPPVSRTLLDIIRDEEPHGSLFGQKDKKTWKSFRERLRLKRSGSNWTSSVPIPASDIPIRNYNNIQNHRSHMTRRGSVRFTTVSSSVDSTQTDGLNDPSAVSSSRSQMTRGASSRFGSTTDIYAVGDDPSVRGSRPQISRHGSSRYLDPNQLADGEEEPAHDGGRRLSVALAHERALSAREAVAAQEAAEAEAAAQAAAEAAESEEADSPNNEGAEEAPAIRMSLMDLLEETDRQMGFAGSSYTGECEEEEEEEEEGEGTEGGDGIEHTCCVCMVRHKGAAFIPCGHTFCRLCSRELWVQRGNCPLCNGFISEILDIF